MRPMRTVLALSLSLSFPLALSACGGDSDTPSTPNAVNFPPVVTAGADFSAQENTSVTLNGSASDPDGAVTILWSQVSGPDVSFSATNIARPEISMPFVSLDTDVTLQITATDSANIVASDTVTIRVTNTGRRGASPQGIDDNAGSRRDNARNNRNNDRPTIDAREVRTLDGSNNNTANPLWGASFVHLQRLAGADYSDAISSLAGEGRESARAISNKVVDQAEAVSIPNNFSGSDFIWQWGQFLDHDLDLTDGAEEPADIEVPSGDPNFDPDNTGVQLIFFSRALFDPDTGTSAANPREQENEITAFLDGSNIYGSDETRLAALRVGEDSPYLKTSAGNLLPFNTEALTNANGFVATPESLFLAGDIRVNEQVGLSVMHTLWMREHNRIAAILERDYPAESPEAVFQLARRLVIAKLQIITYTEFIPALMGNNALANYSGYDPSINPGINNSFSAAAYRLGHSMLNSSLLRLDATGESLEAGAVSLRDSFFTAPQLLTSEKDIDPFLRGMANQSHQALDVKIVTDLRNFLFGLPGSGGLDLASLNIQRGRDHGLPSYNDMRAAMGLARVTDFSDITSDTDIQTRLASAYSGVDEIDLWIGGLAEDTTGTSQLGPLFQAILVKQFEDIRDGDRFWYQNDLTPDEMDRVRGTTLARVIRDNTSIGNELQDDVFHVTD